VRRALALGGSLRSLMPISRRDPVTDSDGEVAAGSLRSPSCLLFFPRQHVPGLALAPICKRSDFPPFGPILCRSRAALVTSGQAIFP